MEITKQQIASLIDNVILKYQNKYLLNYIDTEDKKFRHDVLLTNFAVMFFDKKTQKLSSNFLELLDFYDEIGVTALDAKNAIAHFLKKHKKWLDDYAVVKESYYEKVKKIYLDILNNYTFTKEKTDEGEFFFVEDEGVSDAIDDMHYEDSKKISASEYFQTHTLEENDMEELYRVKEALEDLIDDYTFYSDEFIEAFATDIIKLNTTLQLIFATDEFKDIGYALEEFALLLESLHHVDEDLQTFSYDMIVTIVEDLLKWLDSVFINQDAVDIHYLDASLLSNITQFKMMIEPPSKEEVEDDFLF